MSCAILGASVGVSCPRIASVSGRSAAWLARLVRDQEVEGSNPFAPTTFSLVFIGLFITLLLLPPRFVAHVAQIAIREARNRDQPSLFGPAGNRCPPRIACHSGLPYLGWSAPSSNRSGFAVPHCVAGRLHGNAGKP